MEYIYIIGTQAVCAAAFRLVLGIASSTSYEIRNRFKSKYCSQNIQLRFMKSATDLRVSIAAKIFNNYTRFSINKL